LRGGRRDGLLHLRGLLLLLLRERLILLLELLQLGLHVQQLLLHWSICCSSFFSSSVGAGSAAQTRRATKRRS